MELRQLRYFVAVAEARHFTRAARALRIAPPSLSQQIRVLERDLGVVLLERDRRRVALTPAGDVLLGHARALLHRADRARAQVRCATAGTARLAVRLAPGVADAVGDRLRSLATLAPAVELDTATCPDADATAALHQGRADAALVWAVPGADVEPGLGAAEVTRVPVVLAGASGPILLPARHLSPAVWDGLVELLGVDPGQVRTAPDLAGEGVPALLRTAAAGRGTAVLPAPVADAAGAGANLVRFPDPPVTLAVRLLWREPPAAAVDAVIAALTVGGR